MNYEILNQDGDGDSSTEETTPSTESTPTTESTMDDDGNSGDGDSSTEEKSGSDGDSSN